MKEISIDLTSVTSSVELHEVLKQKLQFPGFYGCNWNAFWDSITGLVEMPDKLEISGLDHVRKVLPEDTSLLLECLEDYNKQTDLKRIELDLK